MKTPALGGKVALSGVLFATDFSAASLHALPYALEMASRFGSKLYPAHVVPIEPYLVGSPKAVDRLRQARQEADCKSGQPAGFCLEPRDSLPANGRQRGHLGSLERFYQGVRCGFAGHRHHGTHRPR